MDNLRGAALMILAMAGFALEDMFIKLVADTIPVWQILVTIGFGGALIYGGFALATGDRPFEWAFLRGASGLRVVFEGLAGLFVVAALATVPISVVTTIFQANPLLVTLGAALFFGATVGWRRWTAILVGLAGVLIVLRPFGQAFELSTLFAVAAVICMSARDLVTRRVSAAISTVQLSVLGFLSGIPAGLVALAVTGATPVMPDARAIALLAGAVAAGVPGLYCIIAAMRVGDIAFVAPFRYSRIVMGLATGLLVFGETLDGYTLIGAAVIVASGLYAFAREARLRRASQVAAQAL